MYAPENNLKEHHKQAELGKLLYESNILHITSYFYQEVIYYSYILLHQKSNFVILLYYPSSDDIQPSTLITDQSPSGLLLDIKAQEYFICFKS